jgi:predicted transcriptional regulator
MVRRRSRSPAAPPDAGLLPEAELELLACLHAQGEADPGTVRRAVHAFRPLSHSSVVTLLRRLEARGLVVRRKAPAGKAFLYRATGEAESTYRGVLARLVRRVFRGDRLSLVSTLFEARKPTEAEIAALKALVDRLQGPGSDR